MISTIVTAGFGQFGSTAMVFTRGFSTGAAPESLNAIFRDSEQGVADVFRASTQGASPVFRVAGASSGSIFR